MSKTPTQGYLDWRANLKPGYYWVENLGWEGKAVHRIIDVFHWKGGEMHGRYHVEGFYFVSEQWPKPMEVEMFASSNWEGFRAEPVQPMSSTP